MTMQNMLYANTTWQAYDMGLLDSLQLMLIENPSSYTVNFRAYHNYANLSFSAGHLTIVAAPAPAELQRTGGANNYINSLVRPGTHVVMSGCTAAANNNAAFLIQAVSATVLTLANAHTTLVAASPDANAVAMAFYSEVNFAIPAGRALLLGPISFNDYMNNAFYLASPSGATGVQVSWVG
jgi:hypothetical protein